MLRRPSTRRVVQALLALAFLALVAALGTVVYRQWEQARTAAKADEDGDHAPVAAAGNRPARVSPQARKNLGLVSQPVRLTTYWRKIDVPGVIADRPGISDRGVTAPVTGVVTQIHAYPGETVEPDAPLFSLRLVSETLHASQLELFKATREIAILREQKQRLANLAQSGALAQSRIIELDNEVQRRDVSVQAYRQDLLARGLAPDRIEAAARGEFVTEIVVRAPSEEPVQAAAAAWTVSETAGETPAPRAPFSFEIEELKVELGQQVEAGTVLCDLADHRSLLIEGHGFKDDMPLIQNAALQSLPVEVVFELPEQSAWPPLPKRLRIGHVANTIDPQTRTFAFFLPLENHWRAYDQNGETHLLWRFRPGQRVRLSVSVEEVKDVFVLPREAVVREGPEAYVFHQNGDLFDRLPVHVRYEDASEVAIANDGSLRPGAYIAQNAAASLNRVMQAQSSSGMPAGVHVHADGTVHGAH
jgi:biotin carboxyl carrier protein